MPGNRFMPLTRGMRRPNRNPSSRINKGNLSPSALVIAGNHFSQFCMVIAAEGAQCNNLSLRISLSYQIQKPGI